MSATTSLFPADALETNRGGRLTADQRRSLSKLAKADRRSEFTGSLLVVAMGLLILFAVDSSKPPALHYGIPVVMFVVAGLFLYRSTSGGDGLTRDLRGGNVLTVEGPITRWVNHTESGRSTTSSYYMQVEQVRFPLGSQEYEAMPDAGIVRVYYLPKTHFVVNFEHLPDRPLPDGALENPLGVVKSALGGMLAGALGGDRTRTAEAKATIEALGNAEKAILSPHAATAPAAGERDPRPLAEAIIGTWQLGPIKVEFQPGGVAVLQPPFGPGRQGHWSVDAAGKLHLDGIDGREQATDAWIVGDSLTLGMDGQALTAHRVG